MNKQEKLERLTTDRLRSLAIRLGYDAVDVRDATRQDLIWQLDDDPELTHALLDRPSGE